MWRVEIKLNISVRCCFWACISRTDFTPATRASTMPVQQIFTEMHNHWIYITISILVRNFQFNKLKNILFQEGEPSQWRLDIGLSVVLLMNVSEFWIISENFSIAEHVWSWPVVKSLAFMIHIRTKLWREWMQVGRCGNKSLWTGKIWLKDQKDNKKKKKA